MNQPKIPNTPEEVGAIPATYITSDGIWTKGVYAEKIISGKINAVELTGSTVTGGTINGSTINGGTINVDTDISVGQNIYLLRDYANRFTEKSIFFNSGDAAFQSKISGTYLKLDIESSTINFIGNVDFRKATVTGLKATAVFA